MLTREQIIARLTPTFSGGACVLLADVLLDLIGDKPAPKLFWRSEDTRWSAENTAGIRNHGGELSKFYICPDPGEYRIQADMAITSRRKFVSSWPTLDDAKVECELANADLVQGDKQTPEAPPTAKTRGEEVAKTCITLYNTTGISVSCGDIGQVFFSPSSEMQWRDMEHLREVAAALVNAEIDRAKAEQREADAKIADGRSNQFWSKDMRQAAEGIASKIRGQQ